MAARADPLPRRVRIVAGWLPGNADARLQAGARRVAMTLGRTWQLMLLVEHAQWSRDHEGDNSGIVAAARFAVAPPVDQLADFTCEESLSLLR
ncbi:MAG TPA: hypothetical protein VIT67_20690 [Povalibacter sp.]